MNYLTLIKWVGGILGGLALAWIVYAGLIRPTTKPNPSTTNQADEIINYYNQPRISFGCAAWNIKPYDKAANNTISK